MKTEDGDKIRGLFAAIEVDCVLCHGSGIVTCVDMTKRVRIGRGLYTYDEVFRRFSRHEVCPMCKCN